MSFAKLRKYSRDIHILFIEDDTNFQYEFNNLLLNIFVNEPHLASNGKEGLDKYIEYYKINKSYFDIIITDLKMPVLSGLELLNEIYKINPEQTVIVLSAQSDFDYLLPLLNIGIEYFFPKPPEYDNFLEKMTQIASKIYNQKENLIDKNLIYLNENLYWDNKNFLLHKDNNIIKLTAKELCLIKILTKNYCRIVTYEELYESLWNYDKQEKANLNNIKNLFFRLRRKIPDLIIENMHGIGYKIILPQ